MSYDVIATPRFKRDIKRLIKKYPSLKKEYADLVNDLITNPQQGTPLGSNCFKIRISIASKGKGKSGGARVITHVLIHGGIVFLLTLYDKAERESISNKEIIELLDQLPD